jgi:hypothetical protein
VFCHMPFLIRAVGHFVCAALSSNEEDSSFKSRKRVAAYPAGSGA